MTDKEIKTLTVSRNGEVRLSSRAREELSAKEGACLIEIVLANCVILVPENVLLSDALNRAQQALSEAGVTVEELMAELERSKQQRLQERYPELCHEE